MNVRPDWISAILSGLIVFAICQIVDLLRFRWQGTQVTGRVIDLEKEQMSGDDGGVVFTPVIEYVVDEQSWRIRATSMAPALYRRGQRLPVYYLARCPWRGTIVTRREFAKWLILIAGCLLFLLPWTTN